MVLVIVVSVLVLVVLRIVAKLVSIVVSKVVSVVSVVLISGIVAVVEVILIISKVSSVSRVISKPVVQTSAKVTAAESVGQVQARKCRVGAIVERIVVAASQSLAQIFARDERQTQQVLDDLRVAKVIVAVHRVEIVAVAKVAKVCGKNRVLVLFIRR